MSQFDMCSQTVTLDLKQLLNVTGFAVAELQESMNRQLGDIRQCLSDAARATFDGNEHENYRRLCNANTARERMVRTAQQLADAIQAHYHVNESVKRDECKVVK